MLNLMNQLLRSHRNPWGSKWGTRWGEMDNNLSSQFLSSAILQSSHSAHHSHEFADCTRLSSPWHQWAGSKGTQSNTIWVRLLGRLCRHKVCKSPSTQNGNGSSGWNKRGVRPRESDFARSVFLKGELKKKRKDSELRFLHVCLWVLVCFKNTISGIWVSCSEVSEPKARYTEWSNS